MTDSEKAKHIIQTIFYATVATVTPDGLPWNSPVYFSFDEQYRLYWASDQNNMHSANIRNNGRAFIVIYDSTVPEGTGEGVYISAKVEEITDTEEIREALSHYYTRKRKTPRQPSEFQGDFPRRIYRATPDQVWVNGAGSISGNFVDVRIPVEL